jgi:preprotein translocase subunit YajC
MYFLIIRPQRKKQKETQNMLSALKKGDRVTSIGGIKGVVHQVKEDTIVVKVDDSTKLEFTKSAIGGVDRPKDENTSPADERPRLFSRKNKSE